MSSNRLRQPSAPVGRNRFEPPIFVRNCCQYGLILSAETAYFNLMKHTPGTPVRDLEVRGDYQAAFVVADGDKLRQMPCTLGIDRQLAKLVNPYNIRIDS